MEPVILSKHPRYHTFYVRFSRLAKPPYGKLLSMKKIVGYAVTDERKAKDILRELKINGHKRKVVELAGASYLKLSELAERYGADPDRVNHSPDTHQNDRNALRQLRKAIGDKFVSAITKQDIKTFKSLLLSRGVKAYTINNYRSHIMAALRWAKENGYTNKDPRPFRCSNDADLRQGRG